MIDDSERMLNLDIVGDHGAKLGEQDIPPGPVMG
jgi:hypothetical protein